MKITVLGSGCFGYPLAFCDCDYCNKARLLGGKNIRKRASLLINDEMIIDLTPDTQTAMSMYNKNMGKVKYLLQTHTHLDHFDINLFTSLDIKYDTKRTNKLSLICSRKCLKDIQYKVSLFDKMDLYSESYLNKINLNTYELDHGESLNLNNYTIKAIHCTHDENIGAQLYLIKYGEKTLLYATDTPPITSKTINELLNEKIDIIFLDESFGLKDYTITHLNIKAFNEYINTLKDHSLLNNDCKIFATHITHEGNPCHDELDSILNKYGYNAAFDGMELNL